MKRSGWNSLLLAGAVAVLGGSYAAAQTPADATAATTVTAREELGEAL